MLIKWMWAAAVASLVLACQTPVNAQFADFRQPTDQSKITYAVYGEQKDSVHNDVKVGQTLPVPLNDPAGASPSDVFNVQDGCIWVGASGKATRAQTAAFYAVDLAFAGYSAWQTLSSGNWKFSSFLSGTYNDQFYLTAGTASTAKLGVTLNLNPDNLTNLRLGRFITGSEYAIELIITDPQGQQVKGGRSGNFVNQSFPPFNIEIDSFGPGELYTVEVVLALETASATKREAVNSSILYNTANVDPTLLADSMSPKNFATLIFSDPIANAPTIPFTDIPEPSAATMAFLFLMGLGTARIRRRPAPCAISGRF